MTLDRHQDDDFAPYLFVSRDFGQTWKTLSGGLPPVGWINVVREHPKNPNALFVGTETGLFVSLTGGGTWTRFTGSFPTVPVDDLVIHPRDDDLIVGTHGRALYVLDDISSLAGLTGEVAGADVHLFPPRPAAIIQRWKHESYSAQRVFVGPNPPAGALLTYHVKAGSASPATLTVRDPSGTIVRELTGAASAGLNRVVWDLRSGAPALLSNARGPFVLPGTYTATVTVEGRTSSAPVKVDADPLFPVPDADRRTRVAFLTSALSLQADLARAAQSLGGVDDQLTALQEQLKRHATPPRSVLDGTAALRKTLASLRSRIGGAGGGGGEEGGGGRGGLRSRAAGLFTELDGSGIHQGTLSGPTGAQQARLESTQADVRTLQADLARALGADLTALNDEIARLKVPRIVP